MRSNSICWFEIYVDDMPRAKAFYESVFQTTLKPLQVPDPGQFGDMEMWEFPSSMDLYGASGALVKMAGYPCMTMLYFSCEDCAAEAARVAAAGGKVLKEKMSIGQYGFIAVASDSEGNVIGLHSMQ
jgi:uncharacterized protein